MLGLDGMSIAWAWVVWGVALVALGIGIALWSRKPIGADLVSPALAGGIGITMAGIGAGAVGDDWDLSWRSILALVVAGVLALATRPAKLRPLTITARVVVAGVLRLVVRRGGDRACSTTRASASWPRTGTGCRWS